MINLNKYKQIYIMCPYYRTGGPKSLHQLAGALMHCGFDVYMFYYNKPDAEIPLYDDLNYKIINKIEDDSNDLLIVPEYNVFELIKFKKIKICIWWLSLYSFKYHDISYWSKIKALRSGLPSFSTFIIFIFKNIKITLKNETRVKICDAEKNFANYFHLYNCEYVREYLTPIGICEDNMHYLCGPLTYEYYKIEPNELLKNKKNSIVFNPAKIDRKILSLIIKKLKHRDKNLEVCLLKNMNSRQVQDTLKKSKIYVDLGYFPGPERVPREAVAVYCNVLTSKIGAASNNIDVPIPEKYKLDFNIFNINRVCDKIIENLENYEQNIHDYDLYREKVYDQIDRFDNDIKEIFEYSGCNKQ